MFQILIALQAVALKGEEAPNAFTECMEEVKTLLSSAVNAQLEQTQQEMMKTVGTECMIVLSDKVVCTVELRLLDDKAVNHQQLIAINI